MDRRDWRNDCRLFSEDGHGIDRSKPNGVTQDFTGVAVTPRPREENVYIASKSGQIVYSFAGGVPHVELDENK